MTQTTRARNNGAQVRVLCALGLFITSGLVGDLDRTGEMMAAYGLPTLGTPIVPMALIRVNPTSAPVSLVELRTRGVTTPPVVGDENVLTGGIGRVDAKGKLEATERHRELSANEKAFAVFVILAPKDRLRGQMTVRLGQTSTSSWSLPMLTSPGTYRADVCLDTTPIWRGFVHIVP